MSVEFPLLGPGGERIDLRRTFLSHGVASLPPASVHETGEELEITLPVRGDLPRTVRIGPGRPGYGEARLDGGWPDGAVGENLLASVRHVLRLDEDLSAFYALAAADPGLAWVAGGAGRMVRSATVFEEVAKTICTTNCSWAATVRMVAALVEHLGEKAPGALPTGVYGRAFPTAVAMAGADEAFYRDVVRAGYRGRYLLGLARAVAEGSLDLEALGRVGPEEMPDDELEASLLALPGVGPYAASHVMLLLGRYSRLILDSWTRPTYARLAGGPAPDAEITRRFARYGPYAGLAFWMYLTRDWVEGA
jgi:3-methyladenine DNA glycosylase/8-oxoguanine DNA glycosylase